MKLLFETYNSGVEPLVDPFHSFSPDQWAQHTSTQMRMYLVQNLRNPHGPEPIPSGPISSTRKDGRYFDGFRRGLFIVAKSHLCNKVLDPTYTPGSEPEQKELFEGKTTFMFSVFNANLLTDMGKTIVRRDLTSIDAQAVWREFSEHMRTSSK